MFTSLNIDIIYIPKAGTGEGLRYEVNNLFLNLLLKFDNICKVLCIGTVT